jgi:hypothetical protein
MKATARGGTSPRERREPGGRRSENEKLSILSETLDLSGGPKKESAGHHRRTSHRRRARSWRAVFMSIHRPLTLLDLARQRPVQSRPCTSNAEP